jgi:hypothetical protein
MLTLIDEYTLESLAIRAERRLPAIIQTDNVLRSGVYWSGARSVGVRARREAAVHRAGKADPNRLHRELQHATALGVSQQAGLHLAGRRAAQDRNVA